MWIRNEAGQYLIQQRAPHLISAPGIWATTAGYVQAGEDSLTAALREVHEELGLRLSPDSFRRFERLVGNHLMQDIWLVDVIRCSVGTPIMGLEVADWQWASKNEITHMIGYGDFFAYSYFDRLPE
ncbi:MAG: NUDIX domain-containing protein [Anaerolineae bacterium]|nr:NUDIX domain-containing protein [Anaerolineae bacterium]